MSDRFHVLRPIDATKQPGDLSAYSAAKGSGPMFLKPLAYAINLAIRWGWA